MSRRFAINERRSNRARTAAKFHYETNGAIKYRLQVAVIRPKDAIAEIGTMLKKAEIR